MKNLPFSSQASKSMIRRQQDQIYVPQQQEVEIDKNSIKSTDLNI